MTSGYTTGHKVQRGLVNFERARCMARAGEYDTAAVIGQQAWQEVPPSRRTTFLRGQARELDEALLGCDSAAASDYREARVTA